MLKLFCRTPAVGKSWYRYCAYTRPPTVTCGAAGACAAARAAPSAAAAATTMAQRDKRVILGIPPGDGGNGERPSTDLNKGTRDASRSIATIVTIRSRVHEHRGDQ